MGCIHSTKKINDLKNENVLRVRALLLPGSSPGSTRSGYFELTPRELVFIAPSRERVVWALQHLRRYGLNGEVFSFEAGRRCMSGPGIYTFRCQQADRFYPLFQRYINAVNTEAFVFVDRDRVHPEHTTLVRAADASPHSNNYLEPAPLSSETAVNGAATTTTRTTLLESISLDLHSPDSAPSFEPFNIDEAHFQQPVTPGTTVSANLYFDKPLQTIQESNNNGSSAAGESTATYGSGATATTSGSAFSTLKRRTILKRCSLDVPPQECAPMLQLPIATGTNAMAANVQDNIHMYANVDTPSAKSLRERPFIDPIERCYENVNRADLPLLLQAPPQRDTKTPRDLQYQYQLSNYQQQQQVHHHHQQQQQPATPTSTISGGINYIVLDLDQPRSPAAQTSPKTIANGFGSGFSLTLATVDAGTAAAGSTDSTVHSTSHKVTTPTTTKNPVTFAAVGGKPKAQQKQDELKNEGTLGYSTIDFIKTYALIKSSTHGSDFDADHDHEESRITRHSKCVRKAYSISE